MPGCPYMDSLPLIIEVGIFMDVFHFWEGIIFLLKREQNISSLNLSQFVEDQNGPSI
jgi:hypothetical protein